MIAGLAGFADGFASSVKTQKQRKDKLADDARTDRYLSIMEKNPGMIPGGGMGLPGQGSDPGGVYPSGGTGKPGEASGAAGDGSLFSLIDATEGAGNYDTLFGHAQNGGAFDGVRVSEMTLGEVSQFADPSGPYGQWVKGQVGRVATPMGRHQIVGTTLRNTMEAMGLSPDTKFTPQIQDSMATYLARNRLAGLSNPADKRAALRSEWEGFKHVSDEALDQAILGFEANGMGTRPMGVGPG